MPKTKDDLLQGTLDLLVLRVLSGGENHGWAIAQRIQRISDEVLVVEEGSLYPALFRLEREGWLESTWGQSENNRRAKFYRLTKSGRKQLEAETESWNRRCLAIQQVLKLA
ncbi:MAG: PadR family transcriptional regulator [Opitutaceae bacterium]|jgi:PadR family transcriptional regulator PadR|nr:PadR family transcriptional regulator [Opitutaceae bacterium]